MLNVGFSYSLSFKKRTAPVARFRKAGLATARLLCMESLIKIITICSFSLQDSPDNVKSSEAFWLKGQQLSELQRFGSRNTLVTVRGTNVLNQTFTDFDLLRGNYKVLNLKAKRHINRIS